MNVHSQNVSAHLHTNWSANAVLQVLLSRPRCCSFFGGRGRRQTSRAGCFEPLLANSVLTVLAHDSMLMIRIVQRGNLPMNSCKINPQNSDHYYQKSSLTLTIVACWNTRSTMPSCHLLQPIRSADRPARPAPQAGMCNLFAPSTDAGFDTWRNQTFCLTLTTW